METLFIDAKYKKKIKLDKKTVDMLSNYKTVALYTAVQFLDQIKDITKQLSQSKIKVITSKPARTIKEYQLIGCDTYYENLNLKQKPDVFLYIGDGNFHPRALVLAQKDNNSIKPVIRYNPISKKIDITDIEVIQKILRRCRASLMKFLNSTVVGVFITTKPGQQQLIASRKLEFKYPKKKFYYFLGNDMSMNDFENFPFIDMWINTACPRIGFDDGVDMHKAIVNLNEALSAEELLSKDSILTSI